MVVLDVELKEDEKKVVKIGKTEILIIKSKGRYYAIANKCTHLGCSLSDGKLSGFNVECPCHGSIFDIRTGKVLSGPAIEPEKTFVVKVSKGKVIIEE